jgi:hypothetical protein
MSSLIVEQDIFLMVSKREQAYSFDVECHCFSEKICRNPGQPLGLLGIHLSCGVGTKMKVELCKVVQSLGVPLDVAR